MLKEYLNVILGRKITLTHCPSSGRMQFMWNTFIYTPILNILVLLLSYVTFGNLGFAIVLITILIKTLLFPLSKKATVSQIKMANIQKEINAIKLKKLSKEEEARETFALYKEKKVNPFSGCLIMLIQLPIIFGLYYVFYKGLDFSNAPLYSFVHAPEYINTMFLGFVDLMKVHSLPIAILTGVTQLIQAHLSPTQKIQAEANSSQSGFSADLQKSMQTQMKYIFPVIVSFISYKVQAAVGLYWVVNNIFTIIQERLIAKSIKNKDEVAVVSEIVK